jgi:hypothetical protein
MTKARTAGDSDEASAERTRAWGALTHNQKRQALGLTC